MSDSGWRFPKDLERLIRAAADEWGRGGKSARLRARDASLWTGSDEARWLGWLDAPADPRAAETIARATALRDALARDRVAQTVLLGMGGSSLCPEVLARIFGRQAFHVLDTTDPGQILALERRIDPGHTLFIVSSKSGTTLETDVLRQYFFARVAGVVGPDAAGGHFVAITDPGSQLEGIARAGSYRAIFHGVPEIGGRYSALSSFGLVPAVLMGIDAGRLLRGAAARASVLAQAGAGDADAGVLLGIAIGTAARQGRDKITLIASPSLRPLGAWIEQLVAESTGKDGKGAIPIDGEAPGVPDLYGDDRLFVHLRSRPAPAEAAQVDALRHAGHPVVSIDIDDPHDLGGEFYRWEIASAVAGSILGINPFDQPDVEASKVASRRLTAVFASSGSLPPETPRAVEGSLRIFGDPGIPGIDSAKTGLHDLVAAHLSRLSRGDYLAILAWMPRDDDIEVPLQEIRNAVRAATRAATTLGFGPRYLHSTGQEHKGGPPGALILQVTSHEASDIAVPGGPCSFGILKAAQARGDFEVLAARGRRILRVDLGRDTSGGLALLGDAVRRALA